MPGAGLTRQLQALRPRPRPRASWRAGQLHAAGAAAAPAATSTTARNSTRRAWPTRAASRASSPSASATRAVRRASTRCGVRVGERVVDLLDQRPRIERPVPVHGLGVDRQPRFRRAASTLPGLKSPCTTASAARCAGGHAADPTPARTTRCPPGPAIGDGWRVRRGRCGPAQPVTFASGSTPESDAGAVSPARHPTAGAARLRPPSAVSSGESQCDRRRSSMPGSQRSSSSAKRCGSCSCTSTAPSSRPQPQRFALGLRLTVGPGDLQDGAGAVRTLRGGRSPRAAAAVVRGVEAQLPAAACNSSTSAGSSREPFAAARGAPHEGDDRSRVREEHGAGHSAVRPLASGERSYGVYICSMPSTSGARDDANAACRGASRFAAAPRPPAPAAPVDVRVVRVSGAADRAAGELPLLSDEETCAWCRVQIQGGPGPLPRRSHCAAP